MNVFTWTAVAVGVRDGQIASKLTLGMRKAASGDNKKLCYYLSLSRSFSLPLPFTPSTVSKHSKPIMTNR